MNPLLIALAALVLGYVALNIRRLRRGRPWVFSVCRLAMEWEQREHARRVAERSARSA